MTPFFSRISIRLLAFNLLLVFLPVAGLLYLDAYEKQLLEAQERSMVQQGRVLSAALSGRGRLQREEVERVLRQLNLRLDSRLRVVDRDGMILGDTSLLGPREKKAAAPPASAPARKNLLYRIGAFLVDLPKRLSPPVEPPPSPDREEAPGAVRASPARMTQVFENLFDNAASFSPDGGLVRVALARSPDGSVAVTVSDEGPGIPATHHARIFDRFFSYRPEGAGEPGRLHTGLGLAIVRAIVEGYGGTVAATNNPDRGAAFTVRIPASRTGVFRASPSPPGRGSG